MGLIARLFGGPSALPAAATAIGQAASGVAEVFRPNATKQMQAVHEAYVAALAQYGAEFASPGSGSFDRFVNALNRLPRPMMALGTLGLFAFAMVDPERFTHRMIGLSHVPEPLWWLLAAIVGFYFGAREAHYLRRAPGQGLGPALPVPIADAPATEGQAAADNPALGEWRAARGG